jgi:hypothetical protein
MNAIKNIIKERGSNVVLIRFFTNIQTDWETSKNASSIESTTIIDYLRKECGIDPQLVYNSVKKPKGDYNWVKYTEVDWRNVDVCIHQLQNYMLFGGVCMDQDIYTMINWNVNYSGLNLLLYTDPQILWTNPFKFMVENGKNKYITRSNRNVEVKLTYDCPPEFVDLFESKEIEGLYVGRDWDKFKSFAKDRINPHTVWPQKVHQIDLVSSISKKLTSKVKRSSLFNHDDKKIYDIVYYGSNRGGYRNTVIKNLLKNESLKKLWIGWNPSFPNSTHIERQTSDGLEFYLKMSKLSLVIGDEVHNDNFFTYRLFENAIYGCLSVIWEPYDSQHIYFPNLPQFYINSEEDIIKLIQWLDSDPKRYQECLNIQKQSIIK